MIFDKLIKKYIVDSKLDSKSKFDYEISEYDIQNLFRLIEALQKSNARLRQDIRQIVREEIKSILDGHQRRVFPF